MPYNMTYISDADIRRSQLGVKKVEDTGSFREMALTAAENQWAAFGGARWAARASFDDISANEPPITQDDLKIYEGEFSQKNIEYLRTAKGRSDLNMKAHWLKEDAARHHIMQQYGLKGVVSEVAAGMLDPAGWLAALLTGGMSLAAKGGRIAHAVKQGMIATAENAALEGIMISGDTQRDLRDVAIAATGGLVLGGAIGTLARRSPDLDTVVKASDEFDNAIDGLFKRTVDGDDSVLQPTQGLTPQQVEVARPRLSRTIEESRILDKVNVDRRISEHQAELSLRAKERLSRVSKKAVTTKVEALRPQLRKLIDDFTAARTAHLSVAGVGRNAEELNMIKSRKVLIESRHKPAIDRLQAQVDALDAKLARHQDSKLAKKELDEFTELDEAGKMGKLFPEGPPQVVKYTKKFHLEFKKEAPDPFVGPRLREKEVPEGAEAPTAEEILVDDLKADVKEQEYLYNTGENMEEMAERMVENMLHRDTTTRRVGPQITADLHQGAYVTLDQSKNPLVRAINQKLLENPQGNVAPELTVDALQTHFLKQMQYAVHNRYNPAYTAWAQTKGLNKFQAAMDVNGIRAEFNEEVFLKMLYPDRPADVHITKAAQGYSDGFEEALNIRKTNGEAGFENVSSRAYAPIITDEGKFIRELSKRGEKNGQKEIVDVLTEGYITGGIPLKPPVARKLAEMQFIRMKDKGSTTKSSYETVVSAADRDRFLADLKEAGFTDDILQEFLVEKEALDIANNVSNRAKMSYRINPLAEITDSGGKKLRVVDLLNTSISETSEKYFREAAGGAALARHGFPTHASFLRMIQTAEATGHRLGLPAKRVKEEAQMLRELSEVIMGRSIESDPSGALAVLSRRAREFTALVRLQNVGYSQFAEPARALVKLGVGTMLKAIPDTVIIRRASKRVGKQVDGELTEPEAREIEHLLGYSDSESVKASAINTRHEDFGESETTGKFRRVFDNFLSHGRAVQGLTSGFMAIQGGAENLVSKSIKRRLCDMAEGGKPLGAADLEEIGFDKAFTKELFSWMKENPKYEKWKGKDVRLLNIDAMPAEMQERLAIGMTRLSRRIIQRQYIGDESVWMNKTLGKNLTQFRTFSIASMDKQLIHDATGSKVEAAQVLLWSAFLASTAYSAQTIIKSFGAENQKEYLDERFHPAAVAAGSWSRMPQVASLNIGADLLATIGALPDDLMQEGPRQGARQYDSVGDVIPIVGVGGEVLDVGKGIMQMIKGQDEGSEANPAKNTARHMRNLIPGFKMTGVGQMTQQLVNKLGE